MSDQQAPSHEDSPAVAGPEGTSGTAQEQPSQAEVDWHKRYLDTQAEYSRGQQTLREAEQRDQWWQLLYSTNDPDTQRQAAEALGLEISDEQYEDLEPAEYEDPYEELRKRQDELEQQLSRREQESLEAENAAVARAIVEEQFESLGVSAQDRQWIQRYALADDPVYDNNVVDRYGQPIPLLNLKQAHEAWVAYKTEDQKSWAKTKRAPYVSPGGQPASEVPNPGTGHEARMDRAMRHIQESQE